MPNELKGYFNDLTLKDSWKGEVDERGIPINVLIDGRRVCFATTIVQKALGHWDKWLLNRGEPDKEEFLKLTLWLLAQQDCQGGWPVWTTLGISLPSPYSAMTQGECISAFIRAWKLTDDIGFKDGARRALSLLARPLKQGGPTIVEEGDELFLEEAPSIPRSSILNGWIFALFGLYDFALAFDDGDARALFQRSLRTLKYHLPEYDAGYWSYYDFRGHLASSFYHDLHIHQLTALGMVNNDPDFFTYRDRWKEYRCKWHIRALSFCVKAFQKLHDPGEAVISR